MHCPNFFSREGLINLSDDDAVEVVKDILDDLGEEKGMVNSSREHPNHVSQKK